jgi:uncharacterized protein YbjT (DUF2867 family)
MTMTQTPSRIAVAGATGRVGRHVVDLLQAAGHDVVPMSRATGVDVVTGEGLAQALEGVTAVVDAATGASPEAEAATAFFTASARNLHEAGQRAGVRRIAVVSIIGCDRFPDGYIVGKAAHERAMFAGPVPVRVLRAAQFHEFVPEMVGWGRRNGTAYVPRMRTQLVAARTVAERLVDLVTTPAWDAAPLIAEIAGPREERLAEVAALLTDRSGESVRIEEVYDPADPAGALYAGGALLPGPDATLDGPAFAEWLDGAG